MKIMLLLLAIVLLVILGLAGCELLGHSKLNSLENEFRQDFEKHLPIGSSYEDVEIFLQNKHGHTRDFAASSPEDYNGKRMIAFDSDYYHRCFYITLVRVHILFIFDDEDKLIRVVYTRKMLSF